MAAGAFESIFLHIVGGIIVSILTMFVIYLCYRIPAYNVQRLVGFRFRLDTEVRITYEHLLLNEASLGAYPYVKPSRKDNAPPSQYKSIEHPVSEGEIRASAYLVSLFGFRGFLRPALRPLLMSDERCETILDGNFVALGGSNYKTEDILASEENIFLSLSPAGFTVSGQRPMLDANLGFILRIRPRKFPRRSWLVCAGVGEWGTSGSAWYLANRWNHLIRIIHPLAYWSGFSIPDFLAVIRVEPGRDESADIEAIYRNVSGRAEKVA